MSRWALASVVVAGCGFQIHGSAQSDDQPIDAAIDAVPEVCTPAETACDGRTRIVCGADGRWDDSAATACDFTCANGACVVPSNVELEDVMACTANAPALAPPANATVILSGGSDIDITCAPDCGDPGVTQIAATRTIDLPSGTPDLAVFCFSRIDLPAGLTLARPPTGGPAEAIAFVVDGDVSIAGTIDFNGAAPLVADLTKGGEGAPGGWDGADRADGAGHNGGGPCGGRGGANSGTSDHWIGGGGGGGGHFSAGGAGGNGRCKNGDHDANGGMGGAACSSPVLVPLLGGSGGGSAGDGTVNVRQGWPGGGGGGALQISSRSRIAISGAYQAAGGAGYGTTDYDGGGGGGAGGALLLEAPAIALTGTIVVAGGTGGQSAAGAGGAGAAGSNGPEAGRSFMAGGQGGSGGGGAGGRVRINAPGAACAGTISPASACTTGALTAQ